MTKPESAEPAKPADYEAKIASQESIIQYWCERVASAEKQRNNYLTDAINETSKRLDLEKQVEELRARQKEIEQAIYHLLLCWSVFYAKLPDGDYDGLGEMRQAVAELKKFERALQETQKEKGQL